MENTVVPPGIQLADLPSDVIFSIFANCDISSIVSTAQTCKYLHALGFDKSVWLALVSDLKRRSFLDEGSTPELSELSTEELIRLVKRILTGPESWSPSPSDGSFNPRLAKEIVLHPKGEEEYIMVHDMYTLIRGGRLLLFSHANVLECWVLADQSNTLLWTYKSDDYAAILAFAAEVSDVDDSAVILICLESPFMELIRLDLRTGVAQTLLGRLPTPEPDFSSPAICGDLFSVTNSQQESQYLIVDWGLQSSLLLCYEGHLLLAHLPGYTILTITGGTTSEIRIIANDALRACMAPIDSTDPHPPSVSATDIPPLFSHPITWKTRRTSESLSYRMTVHESPVRAGTYRIWLAQFRRDYSKFTAQKNLRCFTFSPHAAAADCRWRERSAAVLQSMDSLSYIGGTVYSGHNFIFTGPRFEIKIVPPGSTQESSAIYKPVAYMRDDIEVTPYSGALAYSTTNSIVIQYFQ
ncbi:hypothetical protein K438DRAFT_1941453 [Mycena galopus ATCC 62051]|nr:hypothetical protein K438DRAFT_1941453 [Mycena galopus ATCC 62051]